MLNRRHLFALPLIALPLLALPARAQAQPADALAAALVICWRARGVDFTAAQVAARIGGRTGKAALLAVGGSALSADGGEEETVVEIVWEAGSGPTPALQLMHRDLAKGLPLLLLTRDDRAWLLDSVGGTMVLVRDPLDGGTVMLDWSQAALIGRPVVAGA